MHRISDTLSGFCFESSTQLLAQQQLATLQFLCAFKMYPLSYMHFVLHMF